MAFGDQVRSVWANDYNRYAVDTFNANFGAHCILGDITGLIQDPQIHIPEADIVVGGPPCQGFSLLNKERVGDLRREMWRPYLEVVRRSGARVFVMENVPQLLNSVEHELIKGTAAAMGFRTTAAKLVAADYGVAQVRTRAFIVGCNFADPAEFFPPEPTHRNPTDQNAEKNLPVWRTVQNVIGDLLAPEGTEVRDVEPPYDLQFGRSPTALSIARYHAISGPGMNRFDLQRIAPELTPPCWIRKTEGGTDLFGRLWWDRPSVTIRTEFFKPEKGRYLHPDQHRPITHREAARIQSFPDDFRFTGTKTEIAKQIGNAVPPMLAAAVARSLAPLLLRD